MTQFAQFDGGSLPGSTVFVGIAGEAFQQGTAALVADAPQTAQRPPAQFAHALAGQPFRLSRTAGVRRRRSIGAATNRGLRRHPGPRRGRRRASRRVDRATVPDIPTRAGRLTRPARRWRVPFHIRACRERQQQRLEGFRALLLGQTFGGGQQQFAAATDQSPRQRFKLAPGMPATMRCASCAQASARIASSRSSSNRTSSASAGFASRLPNTSTTRVRIAALS